jgi:hypothetical protein
MRREPSLAGIYRGDAALDRPPVPWLLFYLGNTPEPLSPPLLPSFIIEHPSDFKGVSSSQGSHALWTGGLMNSW